MEELEAQWQAEDGYCLSDPFLMRAVDRARSATRLGDYNAFVFIDNSQPHMVNWAPEYAVKRGAFQWVKAQDILYSTYEGWYE